MYKIIVSFSSEMKYVVISKYFYCVFLTVRVSFFGCVIFRCHTCSSLSMFALVLGGVE